MATIKHILFPFDFSKQGQLAAPFVRAVASRFDARITLLGVLPPFWDVGPMGMPTMLNIDIGEMKRDLQCRLDTTLAREWSGLSIQRVTESGDPALEIILYAESNAVDLIMMPTHGCGWFRRLLIGSVTAKVLHDAKIPVWTSAHSGEQQAPPNPRTILCAIDDTPKSAQLMRWASEYASVMGGTLSLLHVVPRISDWLGLPSERHLQDQLRHEAHERVDVLRRSVNVGAPLRIAMGEISDAVTEDARQEGADLLIIGRGSLPSPFGRIRTHTYSMIRKSPCPVLSL